MADFDKGSKLSRDEIVKIMQLNGVPDIYSSEISAKMPPAFRKALDANQPPDGANDLGGVRWLIISFALAALVIGVASWTGLEYRFSIGIASMYYTAVFLSWYVCEHARLFLGASALFQFILDVIGICCGIFQYGYLLYYAYEIGILSAIILWAIGNAVVNSLIQGSAFILKRLIEWKFRRAWIRGGTPAGTTHVARMTHYYTVYLIGVLGWVVIPVLGYHLITAILPQ